MLLWLAIPPLLPENQGAGKAHGRRGMRGKASGVLEFIFGNVTSLSQKAEHFLVHDAAQICIAAETHIKPQHEQARAGSAWNNGWRTFWSSPESSTESACGTYGGLMSGIRRHLQFAPLPGWEEQAGLRGFYKSPNSSPFWLGLQVALRHINIIVLGGYHRGGLSDEVWQGWAQATQLGALPFIALADFNSSPQCTADSGWPERLHAEVVSTADPTCMPDADAQGSFIDHLVISKSLRHLVVSFTADWAVPWGTHSGLRLRLSADPADLWKLTPRAPKLLPRPPSAELLGPEGAVAWEAASVEATSRLSRRRASWSPSGKSIWLWSLTLETLDFAHEWGQLGRRRPFPRTRRSDPLDSRRDSGRQACPRCRRSLLRWL